MKKSSHSAVQLIETVIPGIKVARTYQRRWLRADVIAGVTVFAMLVPQGMAYGELAGVAPVVGLYAALAAMIGYALFGSSRQLMFGPEAGSAILVATAVGAIATGGNPVRFAMLAALLALLIGVIALIAGLARIGFLADFVSLPILLGYIIGVSLIIISSQFGKLFGFKITGDTFFQQTWELLTNLNQTHLLTLGIGLALIAFLLVLRRFAPKVPGAIIVVVIMIILSAVLHLDTYGVKVIGLTTAGLPKPAIPEVQLTDVLALAPSAFLLTLIIFTDAVLTARSFAEKNNEKVDANRELIGLGAANIASSLIGAFPVAASQSRTIVNIESGGKTQFVGIVATIFLLVFLLWFTSLLAPLPQVTLAAIIIVAALNLINFKPLWAVWRVRRVEFILALVTLVGVLSIGVLAGILIAVALSLIIVIGRISRPHDAVLSSVEGVDGYHDIDAYTSSETVPGLIAYRFDAPLFFANADYFLTHARELIATAESPVEWFLVDAEALIDIDVTAAEALKKLQSELERKGIVLAMARTSEPLRHMLKRSGLTDLIGTERIYPTVSVAVQTYRESKGERAGKSGE